MRSNRYFVCVFLFLEERALTQKKHCVLCGKKIEHFRRKLISSHAVAQYLVVLSFFLLPYASKYTEIDQLHL